MKKLLATLAFCTLAASAFAQSGEAPSGNRTAPQAGVESLLHEFGLTGGPWSADCSRAESTSNWHGFFEIRDGKVTQVYSNGQQENRYEILQATRLSGERLRVRVRFTSPGNDELQTLEWVVRNGRLRTFSNISDRRGPAVTDGKTNDGGETPWVERCR